jgi:hypothetical protein
MTGVIGKVDAKGNHYRLQFIFQSKMVLRTLSSDALEFDKIGLLLREEWALFSGRNA